MDKLWKAAERKIAGDFGGRRGGPASAYDVLAGPVCAEVKVRRRLPKWMVEALNQASASGKPIVFAVFHQHGERYERSLCLVEYGLLKELINDALRYRRGEVPQGHEDNKPPVGAAA